MDEFWLARRQMVTEQIMARGIRNPRLLTVIESIPRHLFVSAEEREWAYSDGPLPIGYDQTISQPYIVALMTDLLALQGHERVLEVGTGSGYQAAVLGKMAAEVHTVEIIPDLVERAKKLLDELGYSNVSVHLGDGSLGWPDAAPYDGILVAAAAPEVPQPLFDQLAEGGRLVIPIGGRGFQELQVWKRKKDGLRQTRSISVAFVPLRGKHGWK